MIDDATLKSISEASEIAQRQASATRKSTSVTLASDLTLYLLVSAPYENIVVYGPTSSTGPITVTLAPSETWSVFAMNVPPTRMMELVGDLNAASVTTLILKKDQLGATELALLGNVATLEELTLDKTWSSLDGIQLLAQLKTLSLDTDSLVTDGELARLSGLSQLTTFRATRAAGITNAGMVHLAGMAALANVSLNRTGVGNNGIGILLGGSAPITGLFMEQLNVDDSLVALLQARSMLALDFDETQLSDPGALGLAQIPTLRYLDIKAIKGTPNIQNVTMNAFCRSLTDLRLLAVSSPDVTDDGLGNIGNLANIEFLDLNGTGVTDAAMPSIGGLTRLAELLLYNTALTDTGLADLHGLTALRALDIRGTGATQAGVDAIKAALPDLQVTF